MTSCEPCHRKGLCVPAVKWCTECDEALCSSCYDSHRSMKALLSHRIVDIDLAKTTPVPGKYHAHLTLTREPIPVSSNANCIYMR